VVSPGLGPLFDVRKQLQGSRRLRGLGKRPICPRGGRVDPALSSARANTTHASVGGRRGSSLRPRKIHS
jgi:hypothetical protein